MRSGLSQAQEQALMRSTQATMPAPIVAPTAKEIPYDYVARFALQGRRGNRVQDVINISIEGAFVAVAIGYSFIPTPPQALPAAIGQDPPSPIASVGESDVTTASLTFPTTLIDLVADTFAAAFSGRTRANREQTRKQLAAFIGPIVDPSELLRCLQIRLCGIDFKYSIVDSGTGRELQNQAIHNIAGLGKADGDRPFRPLAKPMLFLPRSTIRIEVEELSVGPIYQGAELFIVLHGYKVLGYGTALP